MSEGRRVRRVDPERADRIIEATLDVIVERGVAGASHRTIAKAADVPLGSMTYHFEGMDDLLHQAFSRHAHRAVEHFEERMSAASTREEAIAQLVDMINNDLFKSQRDLVLAQELYTLAARDESYRDVTNAWMNGSRRALERHFDPLTVRILDPLIEGLTLHQELDTVDWDPMITIEAIARLTRPAT